MKKYILLFLILVLNISCNSKIDIDKEIKKQITDFYITALTKDYEPISYSQLDTIESIITPEGSIIRITATLTHKFKARSNDGNQMEYSDVFDITIFKKDVIVIPREYD